MTEFLSQRDLDRITEFASVPAYEREPELLVPEKEERKEEEEEE